MVKESRGKELPKGKPRGRVKHSSSTRSQRNILEREQQIQETLRQSEEYYRTLAEQSLMGLAVIQDFRIIYANTAFAKIFGYSIDELLSLPPEKVGALTHPEDQALVWGRYRDQLDGKAVPPHYEYRGIRKDGTVRWLEIYANRIEYGGKPALQAAIIDITEHKRAEESLRLSEQNFRDSIEKSPLGIRIVTEDGKTLYVNKTLLDICGYGSLEELKAVPRNQLYTPESYVEHKERVNKRKRRKYVPPDYEISIVRKDGQFRRLAVSRGEVLWDGEKQFQVVYQDITERKRAEETLRESEERYRALFDRSLDCVFVHDFEGNFLDANETALKLLGYEREDIPHLNFASLLSQDQLPTALATLQEFKETGAQKHVNEFRLRCKDGSFVDVEVIGAIIYHEGKPYAIQGVGRNVTEHKKAEEALRQSEERYRTILEEIGDGYFETDLAGNLTFVNDALSRLLGYSKEEMIGMNFRALRSEEDAKAVFKAYNRVYKTGEPLRNLLTEIICKDGRHVFAETSAFPIRNDNGEIIGFRGIRRDITERRKMEEALQQSEENYKTLFNSSVIGMYVLDVETMTVVIGNRAAAKMAGFSSVGEGIGINPLDFVIPEDREQVLEIAGKEFEQDLQRTHEVRVRAKDGGIGWISITSARIMHEGRLAALVSFTDITERKRIEEALRQSEERYRAILEKMEDSYFEVDLAGNLTFVNSAACRHLGYSREELIRMSYKDFTDEDYIKPVFKVYNEVYRTATPNKGFPWKIIRKDGSPGFIDASVTPLRNDKGEIIGFSGVGRDVTERRKIEEQFILTDRLASIGQLAAGIAHELNNPLTSVIGFSDLLLERDLSADVKIDLVTVNQEARRAINIVKGLLAFAREQRVEKAPVDINSIIQGILQLRSYEQRVSNIEVDARFASALPLIMGNGAQLQQVFINIIINAEQAMLEAHVRGKITITTERVGDIVRASITDDGPGISPDNMKKLFVPFFTTREVGKGTGLGLSICHGIVTEHGGKIYAESELGKGATFVVELPISK